MSSNRTIIKRINSVKFHRRLLSAKIFSIFVWIAFDLDLLTDSAAGPKLINPYAVVRCCSMCYPDGEPRRRVESRQTAHSLSQLHPPPLSSPSLPRLHARSSACFRRIGVDVDIHHAKNPNHLIGNRYQIENHSHSPVQTKGQTPANPQHTERFF